MTTALDTSMPTIEPDGLDRLRNAETGLVIGYDLARFGMAPDKGAPQTVFDGWNQYRHVKGSYIERHDWADRKWVRNAVVLDTVVHTLEEMRLPTPTPPEDAAEELLNRPAGD